MLKHLDLFSGIGGFAYAADQVFGPVEHIFVEFDPFCQQVLKKHWPEAKIYGDIRQFTTNPFGNEWQQRATESPHGQTKKRSKTAKEPRRYERPFLLTGGFPCQPFSAAGLRRGTADERHLWPEMLRVIRLTQPTWVIAENVRGLLTWNEGMVFEQVCVDLETSGYTVQAFVIPAVAVNAPHRRDRIWFVGHSKHNGQHGAKNSKGNSKGSNGNKEGQNELRQLKGADSLREDVTNTQRKRQQGQGNYGRPINQTQARVRKADRADYNHNWSRDWSEVAAQFCSVDDGLQGRLVRLPDGRTITRPKHRQESLKAYGNAIVPQVAIEIMKGIHNDSHLP